MSATYTRTSPSPRYQALLEQYRLMHTEGERFHHIPPEQTFAGQSLPRHTATIKALVDRHRARTLLDYGSGKGLQYEACRIKAADGTEFASIPAYWGVQAVTCYDPGYGPYSRLPQGRWDGVISTDVLEHYPEDDLPWIAGEIFSLAEKFVFANVACYPAKKRLANGENAHCTVRPRAWWEQLLKRVSSRFPDVRYYFLLDFMVAGFRRPGSMHQRRINRLTAG